MAEYFDLLETGRMEKKCAFDSNPIGHTADGEVAIDATAAQTHNHAFKWLEAFAVSFNDSDLQAYCVA
jgi:hypothetical protein